MGTSPPQIAIVNTYGDDNRGSAALNMAAIHAVVTAFPGARVALVPINEFDESDREIRYRHTRTAYPDVAVLAPVLTRETLRFGAASSILAELLSPSVPLGVANRDTVEFLRSSDLVVSRGGVIYRDCSTIGSLAGFLRRTAALRVAQATPVPTVLFGLHAGRPNSAPGRTLMRRQYARASLVLPRGPLSDRVVGDIAHVTTTRLPDSVLGGRFGTIDADRPRTGRIVLSVSEPARPHFGRITDLVERLSAEGLVTSAVLVVHSSGLDSDVGASRDLARLLDLPTDVVDDDRSPDELVDLYATADVVVASRLHATILGLVARTPSFPIELSADRKALDTFGEIGLEAQVLRPERPGSWYDQVGTAFSTARIETIDAVERAARRYGALPAMLRDAAGATTRST